jgi:DNA-binding NarL/FixJ family response regulator
VSGPIKVLLVDDQPLLRVGFAMVLGAEDGIEVVGEAGDGAQAVEMATALKPDVVLMDVRMPGVDGIEATRRITAALPAARVIVLTTFDLDEYAFAGLRAGASGFLLKDVRPAELAQAIRAVAAGEAAISPRVTRRMLDLFAHTLPASAADGEGEVGADGAVSASGAQAIRDVLTPRELEVFEAMAEGLANSEIAARQFVSETTVKSHVASILAKLGLRDRVQAVIRAYESGFVKPSTGLPPAP